jgi:two-component system, OmpR family, sensor histidine kinase MprB
VTEGAPAGHRTLSLRGRVALLVAAAVAVAVAATTIAAFVVVSSQVQKQFDQDLLGRARAAVGGALGRPEALLHVDPSTLGDVEVELLSADGQAVWASGGQRPPDGIAELTVARTEGAYSIRTTTQNGHTLRVVAVSAGDGVAFVLAQSTESTDHTVRVLTLVLLLVGVVGVVVAGIVGLLIARAGLRPVENLTAAAEQIARTEQLTPIPVRGDDELARLTAAFNSMLTALDSSRSRQKQLVADAGHELRTPLTSLRTNLDLLIQSDQTRPEAQLPATDRSALLVDVRAQIEELSSLVGDLVELSRDDGPTTSAGAIVETVDFAEVVDRAVERVRRRAPRLSIDVAASPWEVLGQPAALERAVTNLLDNAAKWSPEPGTVTVRLANGTLTVADNGPGISDADLPHVFERFYRSLEARALPGSGLGLAIVDQTMRRHGGQVQAARGPAGGTVMTVTLPGSQPVS